MNCLDFRRAVLADPTRADAAIATHAAQCPACRAFRTGSLQWEADLADALRVPAPEGLPYRLLERYRTSRRSLYALACAGALLAAVALGFAIERSRNDPLALEAIDFVVFEEAQTLLVAKPADPGVLGIAAGQLGVALPDLIGEMRYVCTYPFGEGMAYHVIATTAFGKATLMLLPGRPPAARATATARGLTAVVTPAAGGSVTVIARSSQGVERIVTALTSAAR